MIDGQLKAKSESYRMSFVSYTEISFSTIGGQKEA